MPTVKELKQQCKALKIKGYSKMKKAELLKACKIHLPKQGKFNLSIEQQRSIEILPRKRKLSIEQQQSIEMLPVKKQIPIEKQAPNLLDLVKEKGIVCLIEDYKNDLEQSDLEKKESAYSFTGAERKQIKKLKDRAFDYFDDDNMKKYKKYLDKLEIYLTNILKTKLPKYFTTKDRDILQDNPFDDEGPNNYDNILKKLGVGFDDLPRVDDIKKERAKKLKLIRKNK